MRLATPWSLIETFERSENTSSEKHLGEGSEGIVHKF